MTVILSYNMRILEIYTADKWLNYYFYYNLYSLFKTNFQYVYKLLQCANLIYTIGLK